MTFANAGGLDPSQGAAVVVSRVSGNAHTAKVRTGFNGPGAPDTTEYYDDGGGWAEKGGEGLFLWVWGTVSTPDPNWIPPADGRLVLVQISLNTSSQPELHVENATITLNEPEITP